MTLSNKIISLIDEGYEVRFTGDDICRGLSICVSKSVFKCKEFIGYETLCRCVPGSELILMYTLDKLARAVDDAMKGRA